MGDDLRKQEFSSDLKQPLFHCWFKLTCKPWRGLPSPCAGRMLRSTWHQFSLKSLTTVNFVDSSTKRCISCRLLPRQPAAAASFTSGPPAVPTLLIFYSKTALLDRPTYCSRCNSQTFQIFKPGRPPLAPQEELELLSQLESPPSQPA